MRKAPSFNAEGLTPPARVDGLAMGSKAFTGDLRADLTQQPARLLQRVPVPGLSRTVAPDAPTVRASVCRTSQFVQTASACGHDGSFHRYAYRWLVVKNRPRHRTSRSCLSRAKFEDP